MRVCIFVVAVRLVVKVVCNGGIYDGDGGVVVMVVVVGVNRMVVVVTVVMNIRMLVVIRKVDAN